MPPTTRRQCLLLLPATLVPWGARATQDPQALLAASDEIRNPGRPFSLVNRLVEYRNGQETADLSLVVYAKADPRNGQYRTLVRFVAPARDANKLMLKNGNDLWFYDPSSKSSIRLSPQQRLLGQVANGDVVTVNFARDYSASLAGEEEIVDGERRPRRCHKLALKAVAPDVTYHAIEMWVEVGTRKPLKGRFFSESGKLLKTAYFRRYQVQLGMERPSETVIIDGLEPNWLTVMRYSDYAFREIPDEWLQRDYLPRFKPE
jgi:Outer membrane lipoprotein-sorting protein